MVSNRILILFPYEININNGGPSGFLAHNLLDKPRDCFVLSQDIVKTHPEKITKKIDYLTKRILFLWKNKGKDKRKLKEEFFYKYYFEKIKAENYKYIFFHETVHLERFRKYISKKQIIILQSHSPEIPSVEYRNWAPLNTEEISFREKAEREAFRRADIIVFPNKECVSIYETLITDKSKIKYILSGAKKNYNNDEQNNYELPQDKINLMYIGRRNKIKGFDIVLETFRKVREKRKDINLIIIGNGEKIEILSDDLSEVLETFEFPRQKWGQYLSLNDYIHPTEIDYIGMFVVSAGEKSRIVSNELISKGEFYRGHLVNSLGLELAESTAEYIHTVMRKDVGIIDKNISMDDILKAKYQGNRYSFGYPACPDLSNQEKLFGLLKPERFGVKLTEGYMMYPEASVSAIVFSQPFCKYFNM